MKGMHLKCQKSEADHTLLAGAKQSFILERHLISEQAQKPSREAFASRLGFLSRRRCS
jgi:hypothetical protein